MLALDQPEAESGELCAEEGGVLAQPAAQVLALFNEPERLQGAGRNGWRQRVREQIRPRALSKQVYDVGTSRREPAGRAPKRLPQRARDDIDPIGDAEMVWGASTVFAEDAGGMAVVHHDGRFVSCGKLDDPVKLRQITVH